MVRGEVEMKMVEGGEVEGEEKIFWEIFVVEENERKEKRYLGKKLVVVEEGRN